MATQVSVITSFASTLLGHTVRTIVSGSFHHKNVNTSNITATNSSALVLIAWFTTPSNQWRTSLEISFSIGRTLWTILI